MTGTDMNKDPISGAPGSHPVGVGVGGTGGALAGASALVHGESALSSVARQGLREGGMGLIMGAVAAAWLYQGVQVEKA